ncbi:MAG: thiolase family protein [Caldilineales bacterium]|nr:thiolase family protein [Caldilineales bacterium]MDW8316235.1 thiolase family protein [Anaerolineae bacterium]
MEDIVLVGGVRTPTGTHGGALRPKTAVDLGVLVFKALIERTGVDPGLFDEVIVGCAGQPSDAANIGRVVGLLAGVPQHVPGYTVHRNCASGMEAIVSAYRAIASGEGTLYLVGGTESMSNAPYLIKGARWGLKLRHSELTDGIWDALTDPVCGLIMGATAENLAERYEISREEQDKYAVESHKKAFRAQRMEKFKDEIVPVEIVKKVAGQEVAREVVTQDEGVNPTLTVSKAALYPTVFKKNGTVTPANSCPLNDAAAAVIVTTAKRAAELGLKPRARIVSYAYAGVDPAYMGIGPAYAMPKALKKAGLSLDDIGVIELNEAFAAQVLACGIEMQRQGYNWDWKKVNPLGGAIALGHPIGATVVKLAVTIMGEMEREKHKYGMVTMCVGGGQGGAFILENLSL